MLANLAVPTRSVVTALTAVTLMGTMPEPARALTPPTGRQTRAECQRDRRSVENSQQQRDNDLIRWHARWSGKDCRVDLVATGEVKFNSDFTDIASIGNGGSLDINDVDGNTTRRMTLRSDRGGLVRRYWVNDREQPWDDTGRRWLAALLIDLDRISGAGIDYRFPSLIAAGGVGAVLAEVEKMSGDYVRGMYLRRLISTESLADSDYQRIATVVSREMSSDYERSRVLQAVFAKPGISHDAAREAVRAASTFSSDVLLSAIENKTLSGDDVISVIETAARSSSDYEKSRVLMAVAARWTLGGDTRKAYLRAADSIRSDYENRRVLAALLQKESR